MSEPNLHEWQTPVAPEDYDHPQNRWKKSVLTDEEPVPYQKPIKRPVPTHYLTESMTAEQEKLITKTNDWFLCPLTVNQFITGLKNHDPELEVACTSYYEVALDDDGNILPLFVNDDGRVMLKVIEWDMVQEHLMGTRPTVQSLIDMLERFSIEHRDKLVRGYAHIVPETQQRENPEYVGAVSQFESLVMVTIFASNENEV